MSQAHELEKSWPMNGFVVVLDVDLNYQHLI